MDIECKVLLNLIVFSVMADPTYFLDINGLAKHTDTDYPYNERNYGLGISREKEKNKWVNSLAAGMYKNSFYKPSYYAGGSLARRFGDKYYMDIGAMGGLITGYDKKLSPMAAAALTLGKKGTGRINLMYVPKNKKTNALYLMNLGIPIK